MKKRIISILICVHLVLLMSMNVFAYIDVGEFADCPTLVDMRALYNKYYGEIGDKYYAYSAVGEHGSKYNISCFAVFEKNIVLLKTIYGNEGIYEGYICTLNDDGTLNKTNSYRYVEYSASDGGTLQIVNRNVLISNNNELIMTKAGISFDTNVPIVQSEQDAVAFLNTGDFSYCINGGDFIDVPMPENVSIYEASEETNAYLYWENSFDVPEGYIVTTHYTYVMTYVNASEETIEIQEAVEEVEPFARRGQVPISYKPLLNFQNGCLQIMIWNEYEFGDTGDVARSHSIYVEYYPNSDLYKRFIMDKDTLEFEYLGDVVTNDYGTVNDAYTGGADYVADIVMPGEGDYSFFSNIFTGFGYLGKSGIISALKQLFSYFPPELIVMLMSGCGAIIGVAIFKYFAKA